MLGLYLTLEEYRKHVKPGQSVFIWLPPNFDRVEGIAGEAWGAGSTEPMIVVKLLGGGIIPVTNDNVFLFQPGPMKRHAPTRPDSPS